MSSDGRDVNENSGAPVFSRPVVVCDFRGGYSPPFEVPRMVEKMLNSVPPKFLNGLSEIVLTNTAGLPRKLRRSATKSRGRKVKHAAARGLYHHEWNNHAAWIEIYIDNTLRASERGWWFKFNLVREIALGEVLFHEIGHHIHFTLRPEFREKEDVADDWGKRLSRKYMQSEHPWMTTLVSALRPILRPFNLRLQEGLFRKGLISRSEFNERLRSWDSKKGGTKS